MTKYQVGDKVKVRKDLKEGEIYSMENGYADAVVDVMLKHAGEVVTIAEVVEDDDCTAYLIEEDGKSWNWTDEMFKGKVEEAEYK